jgi:hypothetical protein
MHLIIFLHVFLSDNGFLQKLHTINQTDINSVEVHGLCFPYTFYSYISQRDATDKDITTVHELKQLSFFDCLFPYYNRHCEKHFR